MGSTPTLPNKPWHDWSHHCPLHLLSTIYPKASMDLAALSKTVSLNLSLQPISLDQLLLFLASTAAIKNNNLLIQPSNYSMASTPAILPYLAQSFLSHACGLSISTITECWSMFKDLVWHGTKAMSLLNPSLLIFHTYGISHGFSESSIISIVAQHLITI